MTPRHLPGSAPADVLEGGPLVGKRNPAAPKRRVFAPLRGGRPVLFLDFDGVLNHQAHLLSLRPGRTMADVLQDDESFDKACVERVNTIVETAGADVVISSSWRCMMKLADIRGLLVRHGFRGRVIGATPQLESTPLRREWARGEEIQAWIDAHRHVEPIAILDDTNDMAHLLPRLVQTSMGTGVTDADAARVVALLGPAPLVPLRPGDYTPGAGGALSGPESALSSLPECPVWWLTEPGQAFRCLPVERACGKPARPAGGPDLRCSAGHIYAGTPAELEQARGALAAAERRAPHTQAERATTRDRLRAEVEAAKGGEER